MEVNMELFYFIASFAMICLVTAEVVVGIILYRNRRLILKLLHEYISSDILVKLAQIERKVNYIGNHTRFEREQLRKMGVLKDPPPPPNTGVGGSGANERVVSFPRLPRA